MSSCANGWSSSRWSRCALTHSRGMSLARCSVLTIRYVCFRRTSRWRTHRSRSRARRRKVRANASLANTAQASSAEPMPAIRGGHCAVRRRPGPPVEHQRARPVPRAGVRVHAALGVNHPAPALLCSFGKLCASFTQLPASAASRMSQRRTRAAISGLATALTSTATSMTSGTIPSRSVGQTGQPSAQSLDLSS